MTHLEYANYLPSHIIRDAGKNFLARPEEVEKGAMVIVDLEREKCELVRSL